MKECVVCGTVDQTVFGHWSTTHCKPCHNKKAKDVESRQYAFAIRAQELMKAFWKPITPEQEARITDPGAWYKRTSMYIGSEK